SRLGLLTCALRRPERHLFGGALGFGATNAFTLVARTTNLQRTMLRSSSRTLQVERGGATIADTRGSALAIRAIFARSLGWIGAARLITNAATLVRYVLFARLVGPFNFGVFAAATFAEGLLRAITDPSFARALVPQSGEIESFLDTVWFT